MPNTIRLVEPNRKRIPRKGKCMTYIGQRIIELGLIDKLPEIIPSAKAVGSIETNKNKMLNFEYADLGRCVRAIGLKSIPELFAVCGIEVRIPEEDILFLHECERVPESSLRELTARINGGLLCVAWWMAPDNPSDRAKAVLRNGIARRGRRRLDFGEQSESIIKAASHYCNALSLDEIPAAASGLDVSLRWMLCTDSNETLFTENPAAEALFDVYKLLPEDRQKIVKAYVHAKEG